MDVTTLRMLWRLTLAVTTLASLVVIVVGARAINTVRNSPEATYRYSI